MLAFITINCGDCVFCICVWDFSVAVFDNFVGHLCALYRDCSFSIVEVFRESVDYPVWRVVAFVSHLPTSECNCLLCDFQERVVVCCGGVERFEFFVCFIFYEFIVARLVVNLSHWVVE